MKISGSRVVTLWTTTRPPSFSPHRKTSVLTTIAGILVARNVAMIKTYKHDHPEVIERILFSNSGKKSYGCLLAMDLQNLKEKKGWENLSNK